MTPKMADKTIKLVFCLLFFGFFDAVENQNGIKQLRRAKEASYKLLKLIEIKKMTIMADKTKKIYL